MPSLPPDHALPRVAQKKYGKPGMGTGNGTITRREMYRHWEGYSSFRPLVDRHDPRRFKTGYRCKTHSCKAVA